MRIVYSIKEMMRMSTEERRRNESIGFVPSGLISGGACIACQLASKLPDNPVRTLDNVAGFGVEPGSFFEDLQGLGDQPFGRNLAAIA